MTYGLLAGIVSALALGVFFFIEDIWPDLRSNKSLIYKFLLSLWWLFSSIIIGVIMWIVMDFLVLFAVPWIKEKFQDIEDEQKIKQTIQQMKECEDAKKLTGSNLPDVEVNRLITKYCKDY